MRRLTFATLSLAAGLTLLPEGAHAQRGGAVSVPRGGDFAVVPFAGYLLSENLVEGPLNTSVGAASTPMFGVQASLPLASVASLVGTIGYASGDLEVGVPFLGGVAFGGTNALVLDAGLELRAPLARIEPLVQLGGGAIRREFTVAGVSASSTDFHVSGGIGVDVPVTSGLALRLMAKDYYGKSDFGSIGDYSASTDDLHNLALTAGLQIRF